MSNGNTFITAKTIAREALPVLQSNLIFPSLIYNDYSEEYSKQGDTVQIRKPPIYTADEFDGQIDVQDITETSVLVQLDKIADVSVELTAKEMALNVKDFSKQVIEPAMAAIAEKINADAHQLCLDVTNGVGTPGTTPSTLAVIANGAKVLNDNKAPLTGRSALWDTAAIANFQQIPALINAEKCGSTAALREGSIGKVFGVDNYLSQQVLHHTPGTLAGTSVVVDSTTAGSNNITITSIDLDGTVKKGDMLLINGHPYTVTADATTSSNILSTKITPKITADDAVDGSTVTIVGEYTYNMMFQKNAFGFVTRPLEEARGADSYVVNYNGLSLRVTMDYDISTKKQTLSIDTLYGFKTLYPELAVCIYG